MPRSFYEDETLVVARRLLGKVLVVHAASATRSIKDTIAVEIVEVEAYLGGADPASHAYRGVTKRNAVMFEGGGSCYVYLSYGLNYCMNVSTRGPGIGEAVLFRAARPIFGIDSIRKRRALIKTDFGLLNGPGKLTKGLGIDLTYNGFTFDRPDFKIVDLGTRVPAKLISESPRIGISKAAEKPWRFFLKDSPWVSRSSSVSASSVKFREKKT